MSDSDRALATVLALLAIGFPVRWVVLRRTGSLIARREASLVATAAVVVGLLAIAGTTRPSALLGPPLLVAGMGLVLALRNAPRFGPVSTRAVGLMISMIGVAGFVVGIVRLVTSS